MCVRPRNPSLYFVSPVDVAGRVAPRATVRIPINTDKQLAVQGLRVVVFRGFLAASEGRLVDSRYVQQLAYELYERGAFRKPAATRRLTAASESVNAVAFDTSHEPNNATEEEGPAGASHRGTRRSPGEESR